MASSVSVSDDPAAVLARAGEALAARPVDANLVLTLLHARVAEPEPGRYWVVAEEAEVVGVVFQSPVTFFATLTPLPPDAVVAVVDVIADAGVDLPGDRRRCDRGELRGPVDRAAQVGGGACHGPAHLRGRAGRSAGRRAGSAAAGRPERP